MTLSTDDRFLLLEDELATLAERVQRLELAQRPHASAPEAPRSAQAVTPPPVQDAPAPATPPAPADRNRRSFEDLLGGRLLALVGASAVFLGVAFLVAIAAERGWIGEEARILLAFVGSVALLALGLWLYERRGQLQAALAMVGAAIGALYMTGATAAALYELVSAPAALAFSLAVGGLATVIAVRWNSRTVAALGIGGALVTPALIDSLTTLGIAFLAVSLAAASAVLVWRRWRWLAIGAFATAVPQVTIWSFSERSYAELVAVLSVFCLLVLIGALGHDARAPGGRIDPTAALLAFAGALTFAALGYFTLPHEEGELAGGLWLGALASAHALAAMAALALRPRRSELALLLFGIALAIADVSFAVLADGWVLAAGWAASAGLIAAVLRRLSTPHAELVHLSLPIQLSLAIVHVLLFEAPPGAVTAGGGDGASSVGVLAAITVSAFGAARLTIGESTRLRIVLDALALATLAYATAAALDGTVLVLAWVAQAGALGQLARRTTDVVARVGALAFLALALVHTLVFEAVPEMLVYGASDLLLAAACLAAVSLAALAGSRIGPRLSPYERPILVGLAATGALYLASIAIVTPFQPGEPALDTGLALRIRQQGQVLLSAFWAACGFTSLWLGLRRGAGRIRFAGFALLALAVAKVFLFDVATLASLYRVLSLVALGLLLLAGALVYQRLRPSLPLRSGRPRREVADSDWETRGGSLISASTLPEN